MSADAPVPEPRLSERAKLRLRLAARVLRGRGHVFNVPRDQFYPTIIAVLNGLSPQEQADVKGLIDWDEDYERAEQAELQRNQRGPGAR